MENYQFYLRSGNEPNSKGWGSHSFLRHYDAMRKKLDMRFTSYQMPFDMSRETFLITARKTTFSFCGCPKKMVFVNKLRWNMIFLVLPGKMIYLFPENMILTPRRKMKDDLSQKNTWKYDIFFRCSEKMVFSKKLQRHMTFLVLSGKMVFFPPKTWYQEIHGNMIFSVYTSRCYKGGVMPFRQKENQKWSSPAKILLKLIDILHWHPRKGPSNYLDLYGDLYRRFHILLSSKKNPGILIYRTKVWLLVQSIRLEIFYNEASSIPCTIQPLGAVFGGALERQSRKLFVH